MNLLMGPKSSPLEVGPKKPFLHIYLRLKSSEESRGTPPCSLDIVSIPCVALLFCVHPNNRNKSEETKERKTKERETTKKSKCHPSPYPGGPTTSLLPSLCQSVSRFRDATFCLEFVMGAPKSLVMRMPWGILEKNQVRLKPLRNPQERGPRNIYMSFVSN